MKRCCTILMLLIATAAALHAAEPPPGFRDVIAGAKPAVVFVVAQQTPEHALGHETVDLLNPFPLLEIPFDVVSLAFTVVATPFRLLSGEYRQAAGTGFIISPDGYVLTNYHVVRRANRIKVELPDRTIYKARFVGADPFADIALLKVDPPDGETLPVLPMGNSDDLMPGDWVIAIGSPYYLKWSATTGIVSGVGRDIGVTMLDDLIQLEASLDPGNSGGPLINTAGQVVGINTAALFMAENKGFAVPINMAREVLPDLKKHGRPLRGRMGVVATDITTETVADWDLAVKDGALVTSAGLFTPARRAGIRSGDVIVEFDGQKIIEANDLARLVRKAPPDSRVEVKVYRGDELQTVTVEIARLKKPFRLLWGR